MSRPLIVPTIPTYSDRAFSRRLFVTAVWLALLGCLVLNADLAISYPFVTKSPGPIWESCRTGIQKLVKPGEAFANGWGIALLLMAFYAVDTARRRGLLRIAVIVLSAGLAANIGKLLIARVRPKAFFETAMDGFPGGVWESFQGWLPWASLGYAGQSMPSGHTAAAVALGIVLCRRWPHAWWAFATLVSMSILQRIAFGHHYASDCFWGAALACVAAAVAYHPALAGGWFDDFETAAAIRRKVRPVPKFAAEAH